MDVAKLLAEHERKDLLRLVAAGSVDDGKSTLIGRLLYESSAIYEDQLADVRRASGRKGAPAGDLDLSLLTDGLRAEREQGITIDVAYRYFSTPRRKFIIADAPGHEQYTRNMATAASTANLAVLLVDAARGVGVQTRRHAFIASLLGISHVLVAVNKMDLAGWRQEVFDRIRADFDAFAARLDLRDVTFIPVSALAGDNIVSPGKHMPWYRGTMLLNHLETVHIASDRNLVDLRLPVQYVARADATTRGYMGTVASGLIRPGDEVRVLPAGLKSRVRRVLGPEGDLAEAFPPLAVTVLLEGDLDVSRGDMIVHAHNLPRVGRTLDAMVIWMAAEPFTAGKVYTVKHANRLVSASLSAVRYRVDVNTLHRRPAEALGMNEIGRCVIELGQPVAYDPYVRNRCTGAFIVIDRATNNTVGAGMILPHEGNPVVPDAAREVAQPRSPDMHVHASGVSPGERAARLGQTPCTVWLTGLAGAGKTTLAYALERRLFDAGRTAVVLDGENLRLALNKDLGFSAADRAENLRRAAEVARAFNEAGLVVIGAFVSPFAEGRRRVREIVGAERLVEVFLTAPEAVRRARAAVAFQRAERGDLEFFTGVSSPYEPPAAADLTLHTDELSVDACVDLILDALRRRGLLPPAPTGP